MVGGLRLKNPLIAGSAEHLIDPAGIRRALDCGVGAVVAKSVNETPGGRDQLQRAEYALFDEAWNIIPWEDGAPASAFVGCRSGLNPQSFDEWIDGLVTLDREARAVDAYVIASLILADLGKAVEMARNVEAAGLRSLELNIGTPYASVASKGVVSTVLDPERVFEIVSTVRPAISIPLWVKITGQSERVPELVEAAFRAGANSVVMAGRSLGLVPDVETLRPVLETTLGVGGFWNLPLTCQWLALSRGLVGPDKSLIGTNGAQSGLDIARMMLAGASAVEMSSPVMIHGFELLSRALEDFSSYLERKGLRASELIGQAADARKTFAQMPLRQDNWKNYVPPIGRAK